MIRVINRLQSNFIDKIWNYPTRLHCLNSALVLIAFIVLAFSAGFVNAFFIFWIAVFSGTLLFAIGLAAVETYQVLSRDWNKRR